MMENKIEQDQIAKAVSDCLERIGRHRRSEQMDSLRKMIKEEESPAKRAELVSLLAQLMSESGAARNGLKE